MMVLVTYDIDTTADGGASRLRRVSKACERVGNRVQSSVFEMHVDPAGLSDLQTALSALIDSDLDSVRFYRLGSAGEERVTVLGCGVPPKQLPLMWV